MRQPGERLLSKGIFVHAWDLRDEGADDVMGWMRDSGLNVMCLAGSYHSGWFLHSHNPKHKLYMTEGRRCYFRPDDKLYANTPLRPRIASFAEETNWLSVAGDRLDRYGLAMVAWTIGVHNTVIVGNNSIAGGLCGSGQIDRVICTNFGIIGPGSAFDSTFRLDPLRVGSLTMGSFATVQIGLFPNRPGGGATNDSIITSNAPILGGAILQVTAITNLAPNQTFTILRNDSAGPVTNTFKNFPEGAVFAATNGNFALKISYVGGDSNDIVLTVLSNTPPTFASGGTTNLTINELIPFTYTNVITDIEQPPQTFTWTLLTPISPCIILTSCREMVRPSPEPPNLRVVEPSAWVNASKMTARRSDGIPTPVSGTASFSRTVLPDSDCLVTRTSTSPRSVNLMALLSKLART